MGLDSICGGVVLGACSSGTWLDGGFTVTFGADGCLLGRVIGGCGL